MAYELIWEAKGLHKRFYERITGSEFRESVEQVHGDPRFGSVQYVINDFLDARVLATGDVSFVDLVSFELGSHLINQDISVAIVTANESLIGFLKQYADMAVSLYSPGIFTSVAAARDWIEVARD